MESKITEDHWKNAMQGGEASPSADVWSGIESELIAAENILMRRSVAMYKRVAAGSVIFALMMFGFLTFYYWKNSSSPSHANRKVVRNVVPSETLKITKNNSTVQDHLLSKKVDRENPPGPQQVQQTAERKIAIGENSHEEMSSVQPKVVAQVPEATTNPAPFPASSVPQPKDSLVSTTENPVEPEVIKKPESVDEKIIRDEASTAENLWIAIGASTGNYYPHSTTERSTPVGGIGALNQRFSAGTSNTVSFTIARRMRRKWLIQSGLTYVNQRIGYTSNVIAGIYSAITPMVTTTSPYAINSVLEFISIPVQAGYLIVDRKIGLQVNAGAAADFFIRNSLQDQTGRIGNFSQGPGSDSPYRSVDWTGLISTEVSYRIAPRYRLSVLPGIRYSFNPVLKSDSHHPTVMDVGFRFRYILK